MQADADDREDSSHRLLQRILGRYAHRRPAASLWRSTSGARGSAATSVPDPNPDPLDTHVFGPDPLVRGMDPDPDPSIIKQK